MDVSFADHSHIIGKGGNTIKKGDMIFEISFILKRKRGVWFLSE